MSKAIPEGWSAATLDRFCDVIGGGTPSRGISEYWGGDIPWASPSEITTRTSKYISSTKENITQLGLEKSSAKLLPPGTVLMTSRASIGYVAINTVPMTTNQGFQSLKCKKDSALADYMYQYITWIRPELEKMSAGSTFSEISSASVKRLGVTLPPLPEQQKIATILSSVDTVIEKTRAQIDKLKDLKTGMMQELLTKGIGHTEFKDSPVGSIPLNWQVIEFGDHLDIRSGKAFSFQEYSEEGFKLLRIDNVSWGEITWESIAYLPFSYGEKNPNLVLEAGDILIALNRPITQGKLKIARLTNEDIPAILYQRVGKVLFKDEQVAKDFSYYWLTYWLYNFLLRNVVGSDQPFINVSELRKVEMAMPAQDEQRKIASILNALDDNLRKVENKFLAHEKLKKALMQDLLTGKVRVNVNDKESAAI